MIWVNCLLIEVGPKRQWAEMGGVYSCVSPLIIDQNPSDAEYPEMSLMLDFPATLDFGSPVA